MSEEIEHYKAAAEKALYIAQELRSELDQMEVMVDHMAQRANGAMFWQLLVETYLDGGMSEEEMRARVLQYRNRRTAA